MKSLLDGIAKKFLLNETYTFDPSASIQALSDIVSSVRVTNKRDTNRLKLAKEHIRGIRRHMKSLNEQVNSLEEQLRVLNEDK